MQDLDNEISALDKRETLLTERVLKLNRKKHEIAEANGNLNFTGDDDLIEINAGGKTVVAKRSTLTQIQGSRTALFSGRCLRR